MRNQKLVAEIGSDFSEVLDRFCERTGMTRASIVKAATLSYLKNYDD